MKDILKYLKTLDEIMNKNKDYLIELDSVVGDGDLGLTMSDGYAAAYNAVKDTEETDIGKVLYTAGKSMANAVPSTMGTLMASGLMQAAKALRGVNEMTNETWLQFFNAYEEGVMNRGKAKVGEKTFLDGLHPAIEVIKENIESSLPDISKRAAEAADTGFHNTTTMKAVHGRAATRGEASIALEDPGAYVAKLLMEAFYSIAK
ncbi:dihydroxyacetone kinase family protein [Breznakia pachnodae]|uniref:Dihydroxyacetone kinase-like protein n=1 Tax=Breznakia pachnodae TaxID=265178 RepID=A0ABU0E1J3_9FIRM|nr:dihydroxyacetone kinase subunit L [Breznakia pachnodae]MDQ0360753.1 dihydroxyacetone kinase-like protein [Breznakia pachnodae]